MITDLLLYWIYEAITHEKKDSLFDEAAKVVIKYDQVGPSILQKELLIGYARADKILNQLQNSGLITPPIGLRKVHTQSVMEYIDNPKGYEEKRKKEGEDFIFQKNK